jgi:DNA-directed RNA polymerase subunit omega
MTMGHDVSLENLLKKVENRFLLVIAAARRGKQIQEGAAPLVERINNEPAVKVALKEIANDKVGVELTAQLVVEPTRLSALLKDKDVIKEQAAMKEEEHKAEKKEFKRKEVEKKHKRKTKTLTA